MPRKKLTNESNLHPIELPSEQKSPQDLALFGSLLAVLGFLTVAVTFPVEENILASLFPKPSSDAAVTATLTAIPITDGPLIIDQASGFSPTYDANLTLAGKKAQNTTITAAVNGGAEATIQSNAAATTWTMSTPLRLGGNQIIIRSKEGSALRNSATVSITRHGAGDINGDTKVDIFDFGIFIGNYGRTGIQHTPTTLATIRLSDMNKDSKVDVFDLGIVSTNYGKTYTYNPDLPTPTPTGMTTATPTPFPSLHPTHAQSAYPRFMALDGRHIASGSGTGYTPHDNSGNFRIECRVSHFSADDPIVYPNQPGKAHLHMFFGNASVNASSTYESLRASGSSTCMGGIANRSAYWIPAMFDSFGNVVLPNYILNYYKSGYRNEPSAVKRIPNGLRMISGIASSTQPQSKEIVEFYCSDGAPGGSNNGQSFPWIPNCPQGQSLGLEIRFPECWNGRDLDSPDHMSHMAHGLGYFQGCPASHPIPIPRISYNIWYPITDPNGTQNWRISSDMYSTSLPGGYSMHGDWFDGWEPEIKNKMVDNCISTRRDCIVGLLGNGEAMVWPSPHTPGPWNALEQLGRIR